MSIISANNLAKSYGPEDIFKGISFDIPKRARIAIVGPNGIGKSTLIKILVGLEGASEGKIKISRGISIGFLPQETRIESNKTLWEETLSAFSATLDLEKKLIRIEKELEKDTSNETLLEEYGNIQSEFERLNGYDYETKIQFVLTGLGFNKTQYTQSLSTLSGGERTRALLAQLLLSRHDLLILDEPTNHLDISAIQWLEKYLRDWEGAAVIVSHDRYFLDRVINNIWEMSSAGFEIYRGNYSNYLKQRDIRWDERKQFVSSEIARMTNELEYIRKNIASQRTQQAKGKLSRLSREIRAVETYGFLGVKGKKWGEIGDSTWGSLKVEEAAKRLSGLHIKDNSSSEFNIKLRPISRSGNMILRANNVSIGIGKNTLFSIEALELHRLECAALIGPNGSGKTTFLNTLLEKRNPLKGELLRGESLKIGYFAQGHENLDPKLTIIQEIDEIGTGMLEKEIRSYLGQFLFSGDDQYKKVSVLSGGERGRLALAKLSLTDANFLILDEPSNHLDIPSQEILQKVLSDFDGTILLVSHDRYLVNSLATQIWEIDPKTNMLKVFKGNYKEYESAEDKDVEIKESKPADKKEKKATEKLSKNQIKQKQEKINLIEDDILDIEGKLKKLGKSMESAGGDPERLLALSEEYAYREVELEKLVENWGNLNK